MASHPFEPGHRARRVCLLSGGGDAPGVNAVIRGFVHAACRRSSDVLGSRYGFEGLLDPEGLTPLTIEHVRGVLPKGGCILGCSTRINPFFAPAKSGSGTEDMGPAIVDRLKSLGIDTLVLIGGDGTMLAAERFTKLGMGCIGIPKTIDNDLGQTDLSCGFDSAVETATHAIDALHSTAEAHARVMLVEVMGRNAGWIALHAGVAGGADVILIPEVPYRLERIVAKIRERESLGMRFSIVVVAEGARPSSGEVLAVEAGHPGHLPRLGGAGARLLHELETANLGHEVRLTVLGHLQRGGSPSASDRNLGTQMGTFAAELCREGAHGRLVILREGRITSIPLTSEGTLHKRVDFDGSLVRAAHLVGIELGDAIGTHPASSGGTLSLWNRRTEVVMNIEWNVRGLAAVWSRPARMMKLGLLFALAGCTTTTEPAAGRPTTVTQAQIPTGCPLGVSGALATMEDTGQGVALTFLSPPDRIDELRTRARHAAALHGPEAHLGLGHEGSHGQGGQHGLQAMQLPPSRATVNDVEAGARIVLVPVDAADKNALTTKAHDGVTRMNAVACR